MKMKTPSRMRGHADEIFVCAELMRRGWFAALTARGSQSFDVVARQADAPVFGYLIALHQSTANNRVRVRLNG
jgi:hypothetical protein